MNTRVDAARSARSVYLAGVAATAVAATFAAPAAAQDQADEAPAVLEQTPTETASDEPIIVTGSRIRRSEFNSPDPITIVDPEIAKARGQFSTAEMLQSSTIAAGSTQVTSLLSAAFNTDGGVGAETVSLRGLGANRTLVLINGRRAGPSGTRGAVSSFDLNVLPQSVVRNVEILKTGASSIYGSDAVAGVVNLITKTDTDGFQFDGFTSVPFDSGGEQYRLTGTWGKDFGRGHIMVSGDYYRQNELERGDRSYLDCAEEYIFDEAGNRNDIIDPRTGKPRCNDLLYGHVWVYDYDFNRVGLFQADNGDNLGQYIGRGGAPGLTFPQNFYQVTYTGAYPASSMAARQAAFGVANGGNHPFIRNASVTPKTERYTAYLDGAYELTDNIKVGTELLYSRRKTTVDAWSQFYYLTGFTNDFTGTGFGDPFSPGWEGLYFLSPTAITDQFGTEVTVDYYRGVGWVDGDFGSTLPGWNFNAYGQYSKSKGEYANDIIFEDSVDLHDLRTSSCVGTTTPISNRPCVDVNWTTPDFLAGRLTDAERAFLYGTDIGNTTYDQLVGEFSVSGPLFSLPAGKVQTALGTAIRFDEIVDTPGPQTQLGNAWGLTSAGITAGDSKTFEIFGELEVPLIHNTPLIQAFTLTASGRMTNFKATRASDGVSDTDNNNFTYSVGANWEVTDWLQFRGRYGTSFRAPALFELFLANQTGFRSQREIDPCVDVDNNFADGVISQRLRDNCLAGTATIPGVPGDLSGGGVSAEISQGGGLGVLEPETSNARTASVIFKPRIGANTKLNLAVDYYDIRINGEIATLGAGDILSGCYNSEFFPDEPLCDLFTRYPTGTATEFQVNTVTATFINVNRQRNEGIDVTVDLTHDFGRLGELSALAQMNWQLRDEIALFAGNVRDDNGEVGEPKWVGDFNLVWRSPDRKTRLFYGLDVIGKGDNIQDFIDQNGEACTDSTLYGRYCPDLTAETTFYHSFSVAQEIENFTITAGISNLFDKRPPRVTVDGGNNLNGGVILTLGQTPYASQYDYLGRRGFISVAAKF